MDTEILSNEALGTHEDNITKCAKVALKPYRLVVLDQSDSDKVAYADKDTLPFGITTDEANVEEDVNVALLGCSSTLKITAEGAIQAGDLLIPGAEGKVASMPTAEGAYTCVGIALSGAAQNEPVEVLTSIPSQYSVTA